MKRYQIVAYPIAEWEVDIVAEQKSDGAYVRYEDIEKLLYAVQEVCSWDWELCMGDESIDVGYALQDMKLLNEEWEKL